MRAQLVVVVVMILGCSRDSEDRLRASLCGDHYAIQEDKSGRTIRLDKRTGEVTVLTGDRLVTVKTPSDDQVDKLTNAALAEPTKWDDLKLTKWDTSGNLTTSWRDGKLYYQLRLTSAQPLKETIAAARSAGRTWEKFEILLYDDAGFKLLSIDVPLVDLVQTFGDNDTILAYDVNESVPCTRDLYMSIKAWNIQWHIADRPNVKRADSPQPVNHTATLQ